jgi:predicted TIM-barrel fold metal-dependent hydrolase
MTVGERLVYQMDHVGIDMMCIMTSDHRRVYPQDNGPYTPNDYLLEVREAAPERFALTCSVDPLRGDADAHVKEITRCVKQHGFTACKLYPSYDHFDPRDDRLFPIYKALVDLDIPMQVHMGWTPCKNAPMKYQMPYLLDDVAARFPELKVVVAHMGWPWVDECMALIAKWENFHADIAYWGWFEPEFVLRKLKTFGTICGYDKLVFGSENSHTHMAPQMMRDLNKLAGKLAIDPISDADMEKIMWRNAARLWKIDTSRLPKRAKAA